MRRQESALLHRRQQRNLGEAQKNTGQRAERHRDEADREVEQETAREQRSPFPNRREDRRIGWLPLRLRDGAAKGKSDDQRKAMRRLESPAVADLTLTQRITRKALGCRQQHGKNPR